MARLVKLISQFFADLVRILVTLTWPVSDYVLDFIYHLVMGRSKILPPIKNAILLMSATELAERIRKKELKCEEVVRAYIERSKQVHPFINAVTDERYDEALEDAKNVDAFLAATWKCESSIAEDTPLLGVPFTCKEAIGVKGLLITFGAMCFKDRKAEQDSKTAALYRKAGAIPLTVTNVPEYCMWWESANHVFGMTKNPYDNARTAGGSSGGEGALITSAGATIGIGNDIAGSIRIPSSFCGIYGHKPSAGIIPNEVGCPELPDYKKYDRLVSTGPMCRYAEDLQLLTRILADNNKLVPWDKKIDFRQVKIYYMEEIPGPLLGAIPDIRAAIKKAVRYFEEEYNVIAVKISMEEMKYAFPIWECKLLESGFPPFKFMLAGEQGNINICKELVKNILGTSDHTLPALCFAACDRRKKDSFYYKCLEMYKNLEQKFLELLQGDAIFFLPTHPERPPHYLMTIAKYKNIGYTSIFCILGFPSTQIPTGLSKGMPIGIQAISRPYQDHLTIAAALELDKVFNGWISPCPIDV